MKTTLLINSLASGGAERVFSILVNKLYAEECDLEIVCIEKDNFYKLPESINVRYLSDFSKQDSSLKKLLYLPFLAYKFKKIIKENKSTLVQSHMYRSNYINILTKLIGSKHKVQIVEVISLDYFKSMGISGKINLMLIQFLYKYSDMIICKAKRMEYSLHSFLKYPIKSTVINNPYDIEKIEGMQSEKVSDFHFKKEKKYIVTVGRMHKTKNQLLILKSLLFLEDSIELIVIGQGGMLKALLEYAERNKIKQRVHFLGRKENPFKYISKCDAFVLASNQEGFPNVLIEAMLCKVAVVSTDCISGPREILAPKSDISYQLGNELEVTDNGILVPLNNQKLIAEGVKKIFNDEKFKNKLINSAYERALAFSSSNIIKQYKEVLCVE